MPNHVHFICIPKTDDALARAFNTVHMRYAQYLNAKRAARGHLWRGRFMSCALDDRSVVEEVRFIEMNPVRWGLVPLPEAYAWSSARSHITGVPDPLLSDHFPLSPEVRDWGIYLAGRGEEPIIRRTRERLRTGRPSGDRVFVRALEAQLGRRLEALPRGRPRKSA